MQAIISLGLSRLAVVVLPMRRIAPWLGQKMVESRRTNAPEQTIAAEQIAWAVKTMSGYTPWDSNCLTQAIAAKRMLQRAEIPSTIYMGVAHRGTQALEAHAWLRSGTLVVTGAREMPRYTVVSTFA